MGGVSGSGATTSGSGAPAFGSIALNSWQATVSWTGDQPCAVDLNVDVESLEVSRGEGGVTALSGPQKALARSTSAEADRPAAPMVSDGITWYHLGYGDDVAVERAADSAAT